MIRVAIISDVVFSAQSLAQVLDRETEISVVGTCSTEERALEAIAELAPDVVLLDLQRPQGPRSVRTLKEHIPGAAIIALAVGESEDEILEWAEAGAAGYVSVRASVGDLVETIESAARGEALCPPRIVASLLHRISVLAALDRKPGAEPRLTKRELELVDLVDQGLANKEIALRLSISIPTVKSHLHNVYEKLGVDSRIHAAARVRELRLRQRSKPPRPSDGDF